MSIYPIDAFRSSLFTIIQKSSKLVSPTSRLAFILGKFYIIFCVLQSRNQTPERLFPRALGRAPNPARSPQCFFSRGIFRATRGIFRKNLRHYFGERARHNFSFKRSKYQRYVYP